MKFEDYKKYRWFYTSSGKLVVGGKSAEQNDELLGKIITLKEELIIMHTSSPGSPFSVIFADKKKIDEKDIEECAIFTGCFSRAWKEGKNKAEIGIFLKSQLRKSPEMKAGTWRVLGKVKKKDVRLRLILIKQRGILRAVPEKTVLEEKDNIIAVVPGKIHKENLTDEIKKITGQAFKKEEILSALPSGGHKIITK